MTLSSPVKLAALALLALVLGTAGVFLLLASNHSASTTSAPPKVIKVIAVQPQARAARPRTTKPKLQLDPNLPAPLRNGLERSREVVAFVYSPSSPIDRTLLAEVRAGARAAHVGFVALNVQLEPVAAATFAWANSPADPATLVVRRPGKVVFMLQGPTDRETVAQAAARTR